MDFDTHCVLFDEISTDEIISEVEGELRLRNISAKSKVTKILRSKQIPKPSQILTFKCDTVEALKQIHEVTGIILTRKGVANLIESERNCNVQSLFNRIFEETHSIESYLLNKNRDTASDLHWGDVHLDVPVNLQTESLLSEFSEKGFSFIVVPATDEREGKAVVTAQLADAKLLEPAISMIASILKAHSFLVNSFKFKSEILLEFSASSPELLLPKTEAITIQKYETK